MATTLSHKDFDLTRYWGKMMTT